MPKPRREQQPTEAELTRQTLARLQEQMNQFAMAMQALTAQQGQPPPVNQQDNSDEEDNPFAGHIQQHVVVAENDWRWNMGLSLIFPSFMAELRRRNFWIGL